MAKFVEGNFDNFQKWIDKVAKEDPAKASDLYLKAAEFNLPSSLALSCALIPRRPLARA